MKVRRTEKTKVNTFRVGPVPTALVKLCAEHYIEFEWFEVQSIGEVRT